MRKTRLRTIATHEAYIKEQTTHPNYNQEHIYKPGERDTIVREYTHWYIIKNNFPYDAVATRHDMLVPKRVFGSLSDATAVERAEYEEIISALEDEKMYDCIIVNFSKERSVHKHFHTHLIVWETVT